MKLTPQNRRLVTLSVSAIIVIAFVIIGSTARVPFVGISPGPTVNTLGDVDGKQVVEVSGAVDPDPSGHLNLTTVSVTDGVTLFQSIGMWLSGDYEIAPRELYYPSTKSDQQVQDDNAQQMASSEDNATGAALTYLKRPTAVGVGDVADNSPAKGKLEDGDIITAVGGQPVSDPTKLPDMVRAEAPGTVVPFAINRKGADQTIDVTLAPRPDDPKQGFLGVTPKVVSADPNVQITYNVGQIGGPSAGLMLTLAVIDRMTPDDLAKGQFVAGTGTISPDGKVGPIGGITHKIAAASKAGASVFLVPADNCSEAKSHTPKGIELVKVDTLTGAVDALHTLKTDQTRPHC
ncbi:MAG: PDZ domain-containing protein [Gordonia sp. (in: high G+C Gram-positive bacteria)]|uniref:YlbL family protein n=1 Tax=Gordonia sp. (in: high G+C Gram-positive bacteria) TaxID=84139 RepID=UPI0039E464D2